MEVRLERDGLYLQVGIAIPGFDAAKYATSDKYWFDLPRVQAEKLATMILTLYESARLIGCDITEQGAVRTRSRFVVEPEQCQSTHGGSGWPEGSFISNGKMVCALCGTQGAIVGGYEKA